MRRSGIHDLLIYLMRMNLIGVIVYFYLDLLLSKIFRVSVDCRGMVRRFTLQPIISDLGTHCVLLCWALC